MNTTLSNALDDILTYKLDIKAAINAKGGDAGDTLSYYATAISNLPTSSQRSQWPDGVTCQNSAPSVDWSQFDTSNVTQMQNMFAACDTSNMTNLSYFDTSSATNMSDMFNGISVVGCINEYDPQTGDLISSYLPFDLSSFNTSNVQFMNRMFQSCQYLTYLDVSSFNTSNVTNMGEMFGICNHLTYLDLSSFNTSNVTNMYAMFSGCGRLAYLDLSSFNTSNVTDMNNMFSGCGRLAYLDLSSFNTSNVTDMNNMFNGCESLTYLDVSSFNTHNVTTMNSMFSNCGRLTYLDLSSFNTSNVTDMEYMFYDNPYLTYINVSSFNTSNVTSMYHMFHCHRLSYIDLSSFNYTNVQDMRGMFYDSTATLINLSNANFATDGSCNTGSMFYVDWNDEDTQQHQTWLNITRTVILNNVSNDVFDYLTKNTCPIGQYGADYDTNSCSIAPNWIIYRDGSFYEYNDIDEVWSVTSQGPQPMPPQPVDPLDSVLNIAGPLTPNSDGIFDSIVYSQETQDVYMKSVGMTYDSTNNRYEFVLDVQNAQQKYFAPATHMIESITFVNLDPTYKDALLQTSINELGMVTEDVDGNLRWSRTKDYDPANGLLFDFTKIIQEHGETMTFEEIRITLTQRSVILTSANIRTANGDPETKASYYYPHNNVNPINTIDENLKMYLIGNPAIICYNLTNGKNSNIVLNPGCVLEITSSNEDRDIAQVIITLNPDYVNDTSDLVVRGEENIQVPNEDNQLIYDVNDGSFDIATQSKQLYITQIEVIYA